MESCGSDAGSAAAAERAAVPGARSAGRPSRRQTWLVLIPVVVGVVAYAGSMSGPFIFDDTASISGNPYIHHLWPLSDILSAPARSTVAGRPVVSLSLAINYALGGLDVRGYHAFNLAIHLLSAALLFGILRRTLCLSVFAARFDRSASWIATAVALLWVVHPLQTECVTYVIQRTELLMGFFYLLTLYCSIRGCQSRRGWLWFGAAVVACGLGMGSKEVMVSAPLVVLLYDRTFISGSFAASLRRRSGLYVALAATWGVLVALMVSSPRGGTVGLDLGTDAMAYLRTQAQVIVWYLRLCFWPSPLVLSYGWPIAQSWSESTPQALLVLGLLLASLWACWRRHWSGFLGVWFFCILAPTSSFIPIVTEVAAERRMYLPLASVVVLIVMVGWSALKLLPSRASAGGWVPRLLDMGLVVSAAGLLGFATAQRNQDYRSSLTIWQDTVAKRPAYGRARSNLARALIQVGRYEEAVSHCREALRLEPANAVAHTALGFALDQLGRSDEAIDHFRTALRIDPNLYQAHNNLANTLLARRRYEEAFEHYRRALDIWPEYVPALVSFGYGLAETGRVGEAIAHYRKALRLDPGNSLCLNNLGNALAETGNLAEAVECYVKALKLAPDSLATHHKLAQTYEQMGRITDARAHYRQALSLAEQAGNPTLVQYLRQQLESLEQ